MNFKSHWRAGVIIGIVVFVGIASLAPVASERGRASVRAPQPSIQLEVDGVELGRFLVVEGLSIEQEVIEYRDGSDPSVVRKLPGQVRVGNLTLKRGYVGGDALWEWLDASFRPEGDVPMKNGTLTLLDTRGNAVAQYRFRNAWPAKWQGPSLNADGNDVAIEEIVLAIEGFDEVLPED